MTKPYSRTVRPDLMITMSKPFANPAADVELHLPDGTIVTVVAATLDLEYEQQQAAYAAEAYIDAHGIQRGPTGARRDANRIRLVDVAHLIMPPGNGNRQAA
jgi:hypothetical protein